MKFMTIGTAVGAALPSAALSSGSDLTAML